MKLDAAASIEKGILAPDAEEQKAYLAAWDAYKNTDKTIVKFVPASGAASRMFKNLFEFLSAEYFLASNSLSCVVIILSILINWCPKIQNVIYFLPNNQEHAASRMFKNLFEFLSAEYDKPTTKFEQAFFDGIRNFADFFTSEEKKELFSLYRHLMQSAGDSISWRDCQKLKKHLIKAAQCNGLQRNNFGMNYFWASIN